MLSGFHSGFRPRRSTCSFDFSAAHCGGKQRANEWRCSWPVNKNRFNTELTWWFDPRESRGLSRDESTLSFSLSPAGYLIVSLLSPVLSTYRWRRSSRNIENSSTDYSKVPVAAARCSRCNRCFFDRRPEHRFSFVYKFS